MLVPILLSVFFALCSTELIKPWFWYNLIKRKTIIGDEKHRGFSEKNKERKLEIIMQFVFAGINFALSLFIYLGLVVEYNFYGLICPIILVLVFQWLNISGVGYNNHQKTKSIVIWVFIGILGAYFITDTITAGFDVIGIPKEQTEIPIVVSVHGQEEKDKIFPKETIASLFKATNVSGPIYLNGKFIYTIDNSPNGYGVVIIEEDDGETAKFIACNYKTGMSLEFREKYPFERVKFLDKAISEDNIPFAKYAILKKPNIFKAPILERYVLQNMVTGEISEYMPDELPQFAK